MNVGFRITDRINIKDANKLLFILTSDSKKGMIAFLYLFDLFEGLFIILISCDGFQYGGGKSLKTIVNINPESM